MSVRRSKAYSTTCSTWRRGVHPRPFQHAGKPGDRLEQLLDGFNADLPMLKEFILPGGLVRRARHLARTVCRRAERALVH